MANLTVTVAVSTGTQYITGNTSSIYTFNGSQPASFTFPWVASGTVRLEQSGSSNDGHPLIFSTSNSAVLATMKAGIISSGVTYYLDGSSNESDYTNTTTFNAATTRYIEIQPSSETDFYFACWVHGIGMGGIMDMTQDTWGALSWSQGKWGEQNDSSVALTGFSATSSLGTVLAYPEQGWGSDTWGTENWGENALTLALTGQSLTTALGDLDYAGSIEGWGRDAWGDNNWGENETTVSLTGVSAAASLPYVTWGYQTWGEDGYGGIFYLNPADVMGLTGVSATGTVGSPTARGDYTESLTGQAMASAVGSIIVGEGVPLTGLSATATVGSPVARGDYTESLSGLELEISVGAPDVTTNPLIQPTGLSATATVGAISPTEMEVGLSGLSATAAAGAIAPTEQTMGLTGVSATVTLSPIGVAPIGWGRVTAEQTGNYTQVTATQSGNWTKITKGD